MSTAAPRNRVLKLGIALVAVLALVGAAVVGMSRVSEASAEPVDRTLASAIEELRTTDQTRTELETAIAALNERNGQATALLDSTAGKVLDDTVRVQLQTDRDNALAVAALTVPIWQADAEKLLADIAATNAAYDASAPAVTANHEQWVVATTPPPPAPVAPKKKPTGGGGGGNTSGGGTSNGGGGGGGGGPQYDANGCYPGSRWDGTNCLVQDKNGNWVVLG